MSELSRFVYNKGHQKSCQQAFSFVAFGVQSLLFCCLCGGKLVVLYDTCTLVAVSL